MERSAEGCAGRPRREDGGVSGCELWLQLMCCALPQTKVLGDLGVGVGVGVETCKVEDNDEDQNDETESSRSRSIGVSE